MINSFPKIFALGKPEIKDIFMDEVEITEKIDGCFDYETPITLADGTQEKIGRIVNNKMKLKVYSYNEKYNTIEIKKIVNWFKNGISENMIKIKVRDCGRIYIIRCTPNHRIRIFGKGWVEARNVKIGDYVFCYKTKSPSLIIFNKVVDIKKIKKRFEKYDIEVEDNHNYFVNNILVHNSQWVFGKVNGTLYMRSKGRIQYEGYENNIDKMFRKAVDYVLSIQDRLENNTIYYCEYLEKEKHNVLKYDRVPKNYLALFGVCKNGEFENNYNKLKEYADKLNIEVVPLLFKGLIRDISELEKLLDSKSILGGTKIEGIVVKSYKPLLVGSWYLPITCGKYVSERFKEVHRQKKYGKAEQKNKIELLKLSLRTEARWQKAVQHLKENGEIENSPKDIGKIIKEVQKDIIEEELEYIKQELWNYYKREILGFSTKGLPEWYKKKLLENCSINKQ